MEEPDRGNAENEMRPFFGFCSHPLSTPRRGQRMRALGRARGRPFGARWPGSGGHVLSALGHISKLSPKCPPTSLLTKVLDAAFPSDSCQRQAVSIFVLYLPHEEPNLPFGSSSPWHHPWGINHLFPFTEHSISSLNVLSRSYTQVRYEQKPWRRRQVGRELF